MSFLFWVICFKVFMLLPERARQHRIGYKVWLYVLTQIAGRYARRIFEKMPYMRWCTLQEILDFGYPVFFTKVTLVTLHSPLQRIEARRVDEVSLGLVPFGDVNFFTVHQYEFRRTVDISRRKRREWKFTLLLPEPALEPVPVPVRV